MTARRILALVSVVALVGAACEPEDPDVADEEEPVGEPDAPADPGEPDGPAEPTAPGEEIDMLVAAIAGEPEHLDPHLTTTYPGMQVLENVYDTLVQPDPALRFEPSLATDWDVSDDGLTWTFHLRDGVTWHNGRAFTADDVVFSYERIMDPDVGAANAFRLEPVEEVRAVDDLTVEIVLSEPTPNLLGTLGGMKGMAVVAEESVEEGTIGSEPVGTGPFVFAGHTPGEAIILEANPAYWGDGPHLDGVEFRFIPEGAAAVESLRSGEVDWTATIPPGEVAGLLDDDDVEADAVASNDYWYLAFNVVNEPFDDPRVRRALGGFGFDREEATRAARSDAGTVNQTAIPPEHHFHHGYAPFSHDPAQAGALLEEAGADDVTVDLIVTNEFDETIQIAQVLERDWAELGVTVEIRTLDFGEWLDEHAAGNFDALVLSWLGNFEPDDFYYDQHHSQGAFNYHGFTHPDLDRLLDQARRESDEDVRKARYDEAVETIVDEVSYAYIFNPDVVEAWAPSVSGYEVRIDRATRFEAVTLDR